MRGLSGLYLFFGNFLFILGWHVALFLICIRLSPETMNCDNARYKARAWEKKGRFYRDIFRINLWKDRLPQHIGKGGFSKAHIEGSSLEYLDAFIQETCRGEWFHTMNFFCAIPLLLLNPFMTGVIFAALVVAGNVPFAMIQRYNRFRLLALRERKRRLAVHPEGELRTAQSAVKM